MTHPKDTAPANPAQVTDANGDLLKRAVDHVETAKAMGNFGIASKLVADLSAALTAAIGAGGPAVAWPTEPTEAILDAIVQDTRASVSYEDARDIYNAILSAIAHPVQPGWRGIESAPKDGDRILVIGGRHLEPEIVPADGDWWRYYGGDAAPTHWMPLPAAPQPKGE